jgi:hypothetical protein
MQAEIDNELPNSQTITHFLKEKGDIAMIPDSWSDLQMQCGKRNLAVLLLNEKQAVILYSKDEFQKYRNSISNKSTFFIVPRRELEKVSSNLKQLFDLTSSHVTEAQIFLERINGTASLSAPQTEAVKPVKQTTPTAAQQFLQEINKRLTFANSSFASAQKQEEIRNSSAGALLKNLRNTSVQSNSQTVTTGISRR